MNPNDVNQFLNILLQLSEMSFDSREEIANYTLEKAMEITKSNFGFIGFVNREETILRAHAWSKDTFIDCHVEQYYLDFPIENAGIWAESIRKKTTIIINDFKAPNPLKKGFPKGHVNLANFLSVPIFDKEKIVATIQVANKNSDFNDDDSYHLKLLLQATWRIIQRWEDHISLLKERERFKIVIDRSVDWETWFDSEKGFYYISPSCERISGYSAEEFYGNPNLFDNIIFDEDKHIWEEHNRLLSSHQIEEPIEIRIKTKNGKIRWIEHQCQDVFTDENKSYGRRGSNREITSRKEKEAEIKQLKGLLPICAGCKKIRDDTGYWQKIEIYIRDHSEADFTHGMCPECIKAYFPEAEKDIPTKQ